jgi:glutamine synthetase
MAHTPKVKGFMTHYTSLDLRTLQKLIRSDACDTVLMVIPDMQGRWMGKRVTGRYFLDTAVKHGIEACNYLLTVDVEMEPIQGYAFANWETGYGDFHLVPDFQTLRMIPWLEKTAMVICDIEDEEGHPVTIAPRAILKKQIEKAKKAGFTVKMGSELEFYLFKETYDSAREKNYFKLQTDGWYIEDYHIFQTTKDEFLIRDIRNAMDGAGVDIEFSKGEWSAGQHEINLRYADALEMADRHTIYKNGVKEMAYLKSTAVTFMAKYSTQSAGSSCHIHTSVWDVPGKKNLFWDPKKQQGSMIFQHFLAGQMALAQDLSCFFAPYVNSYKRYQSGSFAPTKIAWGKDNRTCGFRIVGHEQSFRIENRIPGADTNPYLAYAATIAAGLYGIQNKLKLTDSFHGNAYEAKNLPQVPLTLNHAIARLEKSKIARDLFGNEVVEHYLHAARVEQSQYDSHVTDWELQKGFERL